MKVTINLSSLTRFIDEVSASHGSVEKDAEIIKSIIDGWRNGDPDGFSELKKLISKMIGN